MKRNVRIMVTVGLGILITSLSCGIFGRTSERPGPAADSQLQFIRQWAISATASSEYGNPEWAAHQATGEPDTPECGDLESAWASSSQYTVEWLEVRFSTPVYPSEVNIYESHTPSQVTLVEMLDTSGDYHQVYSAEPAMASECPYILSIPIEDADYEAIGVRLTVDQSKLSLPWDEIDAVELIGYGDTSVGSIPDQPRDPAQTLEPVEAEPGEHSNDGGVPINEASGNWKTYSTQDGLTQEEVHAVTVGNDGTVWIATGQYGKQSIDRFKDGTFRNFDLGTDGRPVTLNHYGLTVAPDGTVWAATGTKLAYFNGGDWASYTKQDGLLDDQTKSVAVANDGSLWVGSVAGVSKFDGNSWESYTEADGLVDTFIEAIAFDSQGNAWFVSSFDGVSTFDGKRWTSYRKGSELPDYPHSSIAVGPDGSVWIGSGGGGVSRFDGSDWTTYTVADEYDLEYVKAIVRATDGSMWFGTEGNGAYRFDGEIWTHFKSEDGLCYDYVDSIAASPDGTVWFGCRKNGVAEYRP